MGREQGRRLVKQTTCKRRKAARHLFRAWSTLWGRLRWHVHLGDRRWRGGDRVERQRWQDSALLRNARYRDLGDRVRRGQHLDNRLQQKRRRQICTDVRNSLVEAAQEFADHF